MTNSLRIGRGLRLRLLGYSEDELKALTFVHITHPEDVEANAALTRRLNAGEIPRFDMEKRYIRNDGASIWVNLTVSTTRDESGRIQYYVGMVEDIEERRQAESRLRQRNRELQLLNRVIGAAGLDTEMRRDFIEVDVEPMEECCCRVGVTSRACSRR